MAHSDKKAEPPALNRWEMDLHHWCPAQMFYYFLDSIGGGKWCIYLRWDGHRGDESWQAELCRCDDNWIFAGSPTINLLEEKDHVPGVITGFYRDEEYPYLMNRILELVKERFPDLDFPNNQ